MALISSFLGMLIYMYKEKNKPHHIPHVHARYREYELSIAANGDILEGDLPRKQLKGLEAWVAIHEDDIIASWEALNADDSEVIKIKGLEV